MLACSANGRQLCEFIVREKSGQAPFHHLALKPEMTAAELLEIVAGLKMKGELEVSVRGRPYFSRISEGDVLG